MLTWPVIPLSVGAGSGLAASSVSLPLVIRAASVMPVLPIKAGRVTSAASTALDIVNDMGNRLLFTIRRRNLLGVDRSLRGYRQGGDQGLDQRRPVRSAAITVVPLPRNASITMSPRAERSRIASATIATGLTVGCSASRLPSAPRRERELAPG